MSVSKDHPVVHLTHFLKCQYLALSSPDWVLTQYVKKMYTQGFVENLPDLIAERWGHGCGSYIDNGNTMVSIADKNNDNYVTYAQVLVVAGGFYNNIQVHTSTEVLTSGATSWRFGEFLPWSLTWVTSVNMDSYFLLIGCNLCNNI